jgi:carbonic anhydrase/acetyltransferase-like protein (isoleucine patch superfamily)
MARIVGETGVVVIGARTSVQDGAVVCTTQDYGVSIGDDCVVEPLAQVRGASVGHRTLIGSASELEEGVVIERNAAVGAKALITCGTLVPVGTRVSGRPARVGLEKANVELTRGLAGGCVSQGRRYRDQLRQLD